MPQADNLETKLAAARTRLILDKPFLGALVMRLPLTIADEVWCPTTATDARRFYFNPRFMDSLTLAQTQFVLAHEALHCALSHFARRGPREKKKWDIACDLAVNPLLINDGLTPTMNALYREEYDGMTAEEIYAVLEDDTDMQPQDNHLYDDDNQKQDTGQGYGQDQGNDQSQNQSDSDQKESDDPADDPGNNDDGKAASQPPPLTPDEKEELSQQWQQRLAGAAQQAQQAGKIAGLLARAVTEALQPKVPWRSLLAQYVNMSGREDFNYARPSRREGEAIMPSLRSQRLDVVTVLDTSGSVGEAEMNEFAGEINSLKAQVNARVTLHACDVSLDKQGPWIFEPWDTITLPKKFSGGGGTDFNPVFKWLEQEGRHPDLLIYFTDGEGIFPERPPEYPVIWLVKGKADVEFGQLVRLN